MEIASSFRESPWLTMGALKTGDDWQRSAAMIQWDHKRLDVPIRIQVLIPSVLCLAVLFAALFWVAVPFVHTQLFSLKRDMICELTETAWYIVQQYQIRAQSGEITLAEAQSRAIERVRSMRYGSESRNYFWILDRSGKVVMHPIQRDLENTIGLDIADSYGKRFIEDMIHTAMNEENGLVEYHWPRPDKPDLPVPKLSHVRLFKPWNWILGTGVYVDDVHAEIDQITRRLQFIFLGCLVIMAVLATWLSLLSRRIETRRRDAEQKLQVSERQNRASLENMVSGFALFELIHDDSGKLIDIRVIQVNPAALRITQVPFDPTGRTMGEMFPQTVRQRMAEIESTVLGGPPFRGDIFVVEFGRWFEVLTFCPEPNHFAITFTDITERKTAEEKIAREMNLRQMLIDQLPCAAMILKKETREIVSCNQIARQMGAVPGSTCYVAFDGQNQPCSFCMAPESWESGLPQRIEVEHREGKWCECIWVPFSEDLYVHYIFDITERKTAEQALRTSEQRFRNLVEASPDGIWEVDAQARFTYCSPKYLQILGYESREMIGRTPFDFMPPDEAQSIRTRFEQIARNRQPFHDLLNRCIRKDGTEILLETTGVPILDEQDRLQGYRGIDRDVTERRKNEDALRDLNSRYQATLAAIPDIVAEVDTEHRYTWLNPAGLAFFGDDAIGRFTHEYFVGDQKTYQSVQPLFNGGDETIYVESWQRRRDGKRRLLGWWCRPLKDAHGRVTGALSTARDITEAQIVQRQREQLLTRLEMKNEELQSVLYTASHDLRSPLVNIQGFGGELDNACRKLRDLLAVCDCGHQTRSQIQALLNDNVPEALHFVRAGADKIQLLLDGLLRLSRVGSIEIDLEILNMNELLGKVLHAQRFQIQQRQAEVTIDPLPVCLGDAVMVNQLFTNLIDNALKYSDPSRPCRIRVSGQTLESCALYAVADNGVGIEPEFQQEVFQIFYRLHPGGATPGEGLGLAIVKRILDRLGGSVRIESTPGEGTTFWISLPLPDMEN